MSDRLTAGLRRAVEEAVGSSGRIVNASGGAVTVEFRDDPLKYFFVGKSTTRYTGEHYLIVILVHESPIKLGDIGRVELIVRRGFLGLRRKILIGGSGILYNIVDKLYGKGDLEHLYGSGYEYIVVEKGFRSRHVESSENSVVLVGRSTLIYGFRFKKLLKNLYLSGRRLLLGVVREVYRGLNP